MRQTNLWLGIAFTAIFFLACKNENDDPVLKTTKLHATILTPDGLDEVQYLKGELILKEKNSGKTTIVKEGFDKKELEITLLEGVYDVSVELDISYRLDDKLKDAKLKAHKEAIVVSGAEVRETLSLFFSNVSGGLVIQEIFFAGTLTPQGKQYYGDQYIKIYNNSDSTLYADGLFLCQTAFQTIDKQDYKPNIMNEYVIVDNINIIPGSGKDYPMKPGEFIILTETAINHKENNTNSYDLSGANFEWTSSEPDEVNNPAVPDMIALYEKLLVNNRGFNSFIIGKFETGHKNYLDNYKYHCDWTFVFNGVSYPMDGDYYKIPNKWIFDAVNLSINSDFQWIVTDPSLDMGWTGCGKIDVDKNRYGKSVKRKILMILPDGRKVLKDTNNSTVDFIRDSAPSIRK